MKPSERSKDVASLFLVTVSVVGLMVFAYSGCALAFGPINIEWILLSLVTILMVSRIDSGIHAVRRQSIPRLAGSKGRQSRPDPGRVRA